MYPSTQGSGRKVSRLMPMTPIMVLIAAIPSQPASKAVRAGYPNPPRHIQIQNSCEFLHGHMGWKFCCQILQLIRLRIYSKTPYSSSKSLHKSHVKDATYTNNQTTRKIVEYCCRLFSSAFHTWCSIMRAWGLSKIWIFWRRKKKQRFTFWWDKSTSC